ncbi:TPA: hypothetical protein DF272_05410 [Candidatus Falkowbacteria bacterium]|nr:hypothetical protein [Candidatus Falkowbacteria bacterium]
MSYRDDSQLVTIENQNRVLFAIYAKKNKRNQAEITHIEMAEFESVDWLTWTSLTEFINRVKSALETQVASADLNLALVVDDVLRRAGLQFRVKRESNGYNSFNCRNGSWWKVFYPKTGSEDANENV